MAVYYTDEARPRGVVLSVIVPTYNERTRLPELLDSILEVFARHDLDGEIVVVDDNSPDGTGDIAEEDPAARLSGCSAEPASLGLAQP